MRFLSNRLDAFLVNGLRAAMSLLLIVPAMWSLVMQAISLCSIGKAFSILPARWRLAVCGG
jgi:hypothetical protein